MKNVNNIKNRLLKFLFFTQNIYTAKSSSYRYLEESSENSQQKDDIQKNQIHELLIYLSVLFGIIIIILVGYSLYKKYLEKKAFREILAENENYIAIQNSISAASQEERQVYSFNGKIYNNKYIVSEIESNNSNNSFDYNHEQRLEKIRNKYGNKMVIKILIKQYIEKVIYNKNLGLEYGDNCTICINNFLDNMEIYRTPCEHIFHKDCLNKYLKKINNKNKLTCPNCNQNLLINKKFLKLRHENENERIKLKNKNKTKSKKAYKKIETINININKLENSININNIDNIETDKKHIIDVDEVLTTVKNNFENKLINKFNNNINININNNNNDSYNDDKNDIILIKKRKIDSHKKHSMTIQHKNKAINIYYPNENMIKNNKTKNEDVLYIDDSEEISEKNDKDNAKSFNINNNNINNEDKNSKSAKGNKKKLSLGKIKFSNVENDFNDNPKNIKELTTNRGLIYKKE